MQQSDILLVDDSSEIAELTRFAILRKKLTEKWTWFDDSEHACDFLFSEDYAGRRDLHPRLILLDLHMPRLSGLDVLRMLKGNKSTSHIPVVIFSTSNDREDIRRSYELGANGYLVKAVDARTMMDTVVDAISYWTTRNLPLR
jgi:CheY-like chemotaxis protein